MHDIQCLGICIIDNDTGACLGCGRLPEEISGLPIPKRPAAAHEAKFCKTPSAVFAGLPPNVAAAAAEATD